MKPKSKDLRVANFIADVRQSHGYLKSCKFCGVLIYMNQCQNGNWIPNESWKAENATPGEFILHNCLALKSTEK